MHMRQVQTHPSDLDKSERIYRAPSMPLKSSVQLITWKISRLIPEQHQKDPQQDQNPPLERLVPLRLY